MRFSGPLVLLALARLGLAAPVAQSDVPNPLSGLGSLGLPIREEQHKASTFKRRNDVGVDAAGGTGTGVGVEESALLRARSINRRQDDDEAGGGGGELLKKKRGASAVNRRQDFQAAGVDGDSAPVRARKADDGEDQEGKRSDEDDYEDGEHEGEGHGDDEDEEYNDEQGDNDQEEYDNAEDEEGQGQGEGDDDEGEGETEQDGQAKGKGGKSKSKSKGKGKKTKTKSKGKNKSHDGESKCHAARHAPCLYPGAVDTLVNAYVRMISKWNDTDAKYLADNFVDTSDSINILAGIPLGSPTFPTKQAFIDHQHTQVSPSPPIPTSSPLSY
jgi:hypothetical protein